MRQLLRNGMVRPCSYPTSDKLVRGAETRSTFLGAHVLRRHQPGVVAKHLQLAKGDKPNSRINPEDAK